MFDAKAYLENTVKPLGRSSAQQAAVAETLRGLNGAKTESDLIEVLTTQVDLPALFGITPGMTDAEVAQHLKSLEMFLNKGMPAVSKLLGQLLKALKDKDGGYATAKFWNALTASATAAVEQRLSDFGIAVSRQEILGILTPERLRQSSCYLGNLVRRLRICPLGGRHASQRSAVGVRCARRHGEQAFRRGRWLYAGQHPG